MVAWYMPLKNFHLLTVAITMLMFVLRFYWLQTHSAMLSRRWVHGAAPERYAAADFRRAAGHDRPFLSVQRAGPMADGKTVWRYHLSRAELYCLRAAHTRTKSALDGVYRGVDRIAGDHQVSYH